MILLIDAGNTRVKIAWLAPGSNRRSAPPLILFHAALPDLSTHLPFTPRRILGSNVAGGTVRDTLEHTCRAAWNLPVHWHDARDGHDHLLNGYRQPDQLGADRWLGLLGLLQHVRQAPAWQAGAPCILASFGTATTIDTLAWQNHGGTRRAAFIGGLILPGAALMARSLSQGTANLPLAQGEPADFPTDTDAAIVSGIVAAQVGALLRQRQMAARACPGTPPPLLFVSGGAWPAVQAEALAALTRLDPPHLTPPHWLDGPVLDGLASLAAG